MKTRWKAVVALVAIAGFLLAQQPVNVANSVAVTGTFWQTTQPVSGTFWQTTQPISGTITANAGTGPFPVQGTGSTSATYALSVFHVISSTSTYNTAKASAGNLYGFSAFNTNTTPCYLVFYNSTAPTVGTTTIVASFGLQAGVAQTIPPGILALANFSTGITYATTTTDGGASECSTGLTTTINFQ